MATLADVLSGAGAGVRDIGEGWKREFALRDAVRQEAERDRLEQFRELETQRLRNLSVPQISMPQPVQPTFARLGEGPTRPVIDVPKPAPAPTAPTAPAAPVLPRPLAPSMTEGASIAQQLRDAQSTYETAPSGSAAQIAAAGRLNDLRRRDAEMRERSALSPIDIEGGPRDVVPREAESLIGAINTVRQRISSLEQGIESLESAGQGNSDRANQARYNRLQLIKTLETQLTKLDEIKGRMDTARTRQLEVSERGAQQAVTKQGEAVQLATARLVDALPQAITTEPVKQVGARAVQLGVDPYAAIALFGIESSFGAQAGATSTAGAKGGMQVTPDTFQQMKRFFTSEENIKKYNIPQNLQDAARSMTQGSVAGDIDAGLLRLKYNEIIGVPPNLWGAAYQTNAEKVRAAGTPLDVTDGGLTNEQYNNRYISLYNRMLQLAPGLTATPTTPGAVAATGTTLTPTPAAAAPGAAPAAPSPALFVLRPQAAPAEEGAQPPSKHYAGRPDLIRMDQQVLDSNYQQDRQMLAQQYQAMMAEMQGLYASLVQSGRSVEALKVREQANTMNGQLQQQVVALDRQYRTARFVVDGQTAVTQLEYAGDPRAANTILTAFMGQQVEFVPRSDGKYQLNMNGENRGVYDRKQATEMVKGATDEAWRKATATTRAAVGMETLKSGLRRLEKSEEKQYEAAIEAMKQDATTRRELIKAALEARGKETTARLSGQEIKVVRGENSKVIVYTPNGALLGTLDTATADIEVPGVGTVPAPPRFTPVVGMNTSTAPAR